MFKSGNHRFLKGLNCKHILNLLRTHQGLTARQLSEQTGLKIATVLNLLKNLEKLNQVVRKERGASTARGGKKPLIWDINPHFGLALGVEWLSTELRAALINFNFELIERKTFVFPGKLTDSQKVDFFVKSIEEFVARFNTLQRPIVGLGVGLAGIIDPAAGCVVDSLSFQARNFPLLKTLKACFPFPVFLDNESNVGALGLKWLLPQFYDKRNLLYVTLHQCFSGMGTGFIFNHQLYRGRQNSTGEWPVLFSPSFFAKLASQLAQIHKGHPFIDLLRNYNDLSEIFRAAIALAEQNEPIALEFMRFISEPIAGRLQLLINLLDPEYVVIGGDILEISKYLKSHLEQQIFNEGLIGKKKLPGLMFSPFGAYTNALGAAATVMADIYSPDS
ncbi:ROK family protein [Caldithrix abyssi]